MKNVTNEFIKKVKITRFDPTFWQTGEAYLIKRGPVKIPYPIIVTGTSMDDYGLYAIKIVDVNGDKQSIDLNTWIAERYKVKPQECKECAKEKYRDDPYYSFVPINKLLIILK